MTRKDVFKRLNCVFCEVFDDDTIEITESTTAKDIEDWDSLEHINLIVAIENEFNISIPMSRTLEMKNVDEMVDVIMELIQ